MNDKIDKMLEERGNNYGPFSTHAEITQHLKQSLYHDNSKLSPTQKEALEMIFHKIGRIINGDPNYLDSWQDIIGYAQLVVKELEEEESCIDDSIYNILQTQKERTEKKYRESKAKLRS